MAEKITSRSDNYSQWYIDIILQAKLADYSPVKGCMVIRPRGYAIWEKIQAVLDGMFKDTGHVNAYFPLLIPESFLKKEAEHIEGFSPELAVVTHAGGELLEEPLILRPTSETIIWSMYKRWIQSYRDLPILINQWANVLRWEKRTRLFLRTTEFLWQEGHTAHETKEEALAETLKMLGVYKQFAEEYMALPVLAGIKSESEKFAGAVDTYAIEAMMQDKKALQAGTSHFLGQNFAKAFDVTFQTRNGSLEPVWASSWGVSTRLVGALIMAHSDDNGLVLPPRLAPTEVVVIPIYKNENKTDVLNYAGGIHEKLKARFRTVFDDDDQNSPGWKFTEWEMLGVPVRVEIGPKDMANGNVMLVRRDTREKKSVKAEQAEAVIQDLLTDIHRNLYNKALKFRNDNTSDIASYKDFTDFFEKDSGFAVAAWCGSRECEAKVKEETKATIRIVPETDPSTLTKGCVVCGSKAQALPVFAKSY
ncbi:MAG: proline--tRNA ligase [Spirochaetales bacterium]|nr:MAG: proline--tRNA ligase [Spirochaetales bacterium]